MMKAIIIIAMLALFSCGRESSPEGRMQIRTEQLQAELDSLKRQNSALFDSISSLRQELEALRRQRSRLHP